MMLTESRTRYRQWTCLLLLAGVLAMQQRPASGQRPQNSSSADAQTLQLDAAIERAQAAQAAGHYGDAADAYARATSIDKSVPELWANLGLMEHLAGRRSDAIVSFRRAIALNPGLFTPQLFLGLDELEAGNPSRAVIYLEHARTLRPSDLQVPLALGRAYTAMHEARAAAAAYEAATAIDPGNPNAWYGLGVASISIIEQDGGALARNHPDSVWTRALYADDLILQGRLTEATDIYKKIAAIASPEQRVIFTAILRRAGEVSSAAESSVLTPSVLEKLIAAVNAPATVTSIGCTDSSLGAKQMSCLYLHHEDAAASLAAAKRLRERPDDLETLFWSAKANEHRAVDALAHFEELVPHSAATYDLLGDLDRRRLQPDAALEQYDKALALAPHDPSALLGRAAALLSIGRFDESIATANIGLADAPDDPRLNLLMGEALVDRHRFTESEPFLDRTLFFATSKDANAGIAALAPRAHALKGRVKAEAGATDQAIVEMALGLSSDHDGSLSFQLSRLYRSAGRMDDARRAEAQAKTLQAQRRINAVTAVQGSTAPLPD